MINVCIVKQQMMFVIINSQKIISRQHKFVLFVYILFISHCASIFLLRSMDISYSPVQKRLTYFADKSAAMVYLLNTSLRNIFISTRVSRLKMCRLKGRVKEIPKYVQINDKRCVANRLNISDYTFSDNWNWNKITRYVKVVPNN